MRSREMGRAPTNCMGGFYHGGREKQPGLETGGGGCNEGKKLQHKLPGRSLGACPTPPRFPSVSPGCSIPFPPAPSVPLAPALRYRLAGSPLAHRCSIPWGTQGSSLGLSLWLSQEASQNLFPFLRLTVLSKLVEM